MAFRTERKRAGRGLNETAEYLGVTKQAVNGWERGAFEPGIGALKKMAEFYGCTVDELLAPEETD